MTDKNKPDGTEDKAQLAALGEHLRKVADGTIKPVDPAALAKQTTPRWGFTPEELAKLDAARKGNQPKP